MKTESGIKKFIKKIKWVASVTHLFIQLRIKRREKFLLKSCSIVLCISLIIILLIEWKQYKDDKEILTVQSEMTESIELAENGIKELKQPTAGAETILDKAYITMEMSTGEPFMIPEYAKILPEYVDLYEQNTDIIGWLRIGDTVIDYPVMQTMEDENYYLSYDFNKEPNQNGCLIMDTDSVVGTGTAQWNYENGTAPSANLIIHGHTMKSGLMFGGLKKYAEEEYGKTHNIICFNSLYERREYELIAVFYSQVYMNTDDIFKYYQFFEADTQEEFDEWYYNIKSMSLYDTGIAAEFGDEFITLSCCSYHVEDGRFVVIGKRIN